MAQAGFVLEGVAELLKELQAAVPTPGDTNTLLHRVADPIMNDIINQIPVRKGGLKASIRSIDFRSNRVVIGAKYPEGAHIFLVENGTVERKTAKGAYRGKMPAKNIVQTVYLKNKTAAENQLKNEFEKHITSRIH